MDLENQYGTLEIQKSLLVLLKAFDAFCQKEGLTYSLDSGSLLGAVRHKGFIPWDDDLDVVVDRANYNRLISSIGSSNALVIERITESTLWVDRIRLLHTDYSGSYKPTLDVFILDSIPDNKINAFLKKYIIFMLQGMLKYHLSVNKGSFLMRVCAFVTFFMGRPFSHRTKYNWYNKVSQWWNNVPSHFATCYNYIFSEVGTKYHSDMMQKVILKDFEDMKAPITSDYDFVLKQLYGDYLTPPKEGARKPIHLG